jgi:hypothetical protein
MRRTPLIALVLFALTLLIAPAASAATGSVSDPAGDFPDIRKLSYNNATGKVVMTMRYASLDDAQNQSFYIRWGTSANYQVFVSPSAGLEELRFNSKKRACSGLQVTALPDTQSTRVVVPRSCIPRAPNKLKFKGIATQGLSLVDETALSPWVGRG